MKTLTPEEAIKLFENNGLIPEPEIYFNRETCEACLVGAIVVNTFGRDRMSWPGYGVWSAAEEAGYNEDYLEGAERGFMHNGAPVKGRYENYDAALEGYALGVAVRKHFYGVLNEEDDGQED